MNEQGVVIAIGLVVAVVIAWPLARRRIEKRTPPAERGAGAPSEELAELELDRAMGRVSEEDYARFRRELEAHAGAGAGESPASPAPDDAVATAEALVRRWKEAPRPTCPNCGLRPEPEARYCSNCGASLGA